MGSDQSSRRVSGRPWPAYVAGALLLGLLAAAHAARGSAHSPMSITPGSASPGDRVTVRFDEPREVTDTLEFFDGDDVHELSDGSWTEIVPGWSLSLIVPARSSFAVTLPDDIDPGHYRVCVGTFDLEDLCAPLTVR